MVQNELSHTNCGLTAILECHLTTPQTEISMDINQGKQLQNHATLVDIFTCTDQGSLINLPSSIGLTLAHWWGVTTCRGEAGIHRIILSGQFSGQTMHLHGLHLHVLRALGQQAGPIMALWLCLGQCQVRTHMVCHLVGTILQLK